MYIIQSRKPNLSLEKLNAESNYIAYYRVILSAMMCYCETYWYSKKTLSKQSCSD